MERLVLEQFKAWKNKDNSNIINNNFHPFEIPGKIQVLKKFPMTSSGKIDYAAFSRK